MTDWIEHAQRFVVSDFKDQAAWDAAQASCQNPQIREFLNDCPITLKTAVERVQTG